MLSVEQRTAFEATIGLVKAAAKPLLRGGDRRLVQTMDKLVRRIRLILETDKDIVDRMRAPRPGTAPKGEMTEAEKKAFGTRRGFKRKAKEPAAEPVAEVAQ